MPRPGAPQAEAGEPFPERRNRPFCGDAALLQHHQAGSEVSIDPEGNVFPCCFKTRLPAGNVLNRKLDDLLDSLAGHPVYEAITMGHPHLLGDKAYIDELLGAIDKVNHNLKAAAKVWADLQAKQKK